MSHIQPLPPDGRAWVIEALTDAETGQLDLIMLPVTISASLTRMPAANVALVGFEHGGDD